MHATVYSPLRRRNSLAFSHHVEVARLPKADAERILDQPGAGRPLRATAVYSDDRAGLVTVESAVLDPRTPLREPCNASW